MMSLMLACTKATPSAPAASAVSSAPAPASANGPRIILPDGFTVHLEIASDEDTRQQGLMYRDRLPDATGMIFIFPAAGDYPFWMKNTLIPLDMVWIDANKKIVHVAHDVPPCKADPCPNYPPHAVALYVLELAGGEAAKHRLADGQTLRFEGLDKLIVR
jgi:uncharacterized membrane protein (UPF0127 family)